jgi:hypothetical protein
LIGAQKKTRIIIVIFFCICCKVFLSVKSFFYVYHFVGDAIIEAIQKSGIKYIVNLSGCGGHMHEGNGIIAGAGRAGSEIKSLKDINVLHLRPSYFMENLFVEYRND